MLRIFSDSEEEADDHQVAAAEHARDFNESITQGLRDSAVVHLIHTGEQQLSKSTSPFDQTDADLEAIIKRAQNVPISTAFPDPSFLENGHDDNIALNRNELIQPSFLISFMVDARGGAMRGCRHSGVRVIIPPRKAEAPTRITCRYLKKAFNHSKIQKIKFFFNFKEKLPAPLRLSEGEALASRILEMGPAGAKFLGPVILEVPHFASLRGREREIEVLNESFDAQELQQLDELHTSRITRILTNDFPMYFAVVTRVRQEVHCVGPEGGVILSSVVPHVQAIFPDGSLTKTIKVSLQAQPVPQELVTKLHGNRVAVSPIVTVEPRRRKFHKPITLCIPLPQSTNKGMLTQYQQQPQEKPGKDQKEQPQHEPPTLRLLCSITGGVMPAQWEDITGTTQLTFAGDETPRDAAKMAQEIYNEAIAIPFMARFAVFARRSFPTEGQLRMFCMTDDKEEKTLEKQEGFQRIAVSRDVEVLEGKHQWLEFAGNLVPVTKRGDQLAVFFQPFQENRLAFNIKVRQQDDQESASSGKVAVMKEPLNRADTLPPQHPICILSITLPDYTGPLPSLILSEQKGGGGGEDDFFKKQAPLTQRYSDALLTNVAEIYPNIPIEFVSKTIGADWARLGRVLGIHPDDIRQIRREVPSGGGQEALHMLKIWVFLKGTSANESDLRQALRQIGRDDICVRMTDSDNHLMGAADSDINLSSAAIGTPVNLRQDFSSKGSLVTPTQANIIVPQQSPPIEVSAVAAAITPTAEPLFAAQPVTLTAPEQQIDVETVVTRTERHVHHSEDINEPVVDERVTRQIFRDGQQVK
uniref:ZU5 domain-containing protein n=1 Tax=Meloidogyne hapla TaxID=6305 RepID=A0A1I8BMQ0_MELHA